MPPYCVSRVGVLGLLATAAAMLLAAGCSPSGDIGTAASVELGESRPPAAADRADTAPDADEAAEPAAQADQFGRENRDVTDQPATEQGDQLPQPTEVPDEAPAQPTEEKTMPDAAERPAIVERPPRRNPLRKGDEAAPGSPATTPVRSPNAHWHKGKHDGEPFDPIKVNGPIFVDWRQPKLALVITGRQDGYLEPCGCAGLERMKGGLSRRHTMFRTLRKEKGWPVVGLDVGGINSSEGFGRQAEMKFQTTVDAMKLMGYDAIGFGTSELRLPAGELLSVAAPVEGKQGTFVSADVELFAAGSGYPAPRIIAEAAGMKLGITSVLGKEYQKQINNPDLAMSDPQEALAKVLPALREECDLLILLAHATMDESIELAKQFPDLDLVITAGGPPEPPAKAKSIPGTKTLLIEVGQKGENAVVLGLYDDPGERFRYQRVPLDSRFAASREMKLLMTNYQDQLKAEGFAGLGLRPVPHPRKDVLGKFVGSKECESCHEESYDVWKKSGHAKAYETLAGLDPPRQHDPECISCHVIGWHPQKCFPYQTGYRSIEETPKLIDVGCECCHGPGKAHVDAEMGSDEQLQLKLQQAMVISREESEEANKEARRRMCLACHDLDNSPDFTFDDYWPDVEHREDAEEEEQQ